jgi:hypothetical protein
MSFVVPQVADFKAQFALDFPYGDGTAAVSDPEIQNGLNLTASGAYFNPALFDLKPLGAAGANPTTTEAALAFLYCSAHFVWKRVQARGGLRAPAFKGGAKSAGLGVDQSATVGPVSKTKKWPASIEDDAMLFQFTQSPYGEFYLQMLMPKLVGNIALVMGERLPTGFGS